MSAPYLLGRGSMHYMGLKTEEERAAYKAECDNLWLEVVTEYCDSMFAGRKHLSLNTYSDGCTGVLCTMANRVHKRTTRGGGTSPYWEVYEDVLTSFNRSATEERYRRIELAMAYWYRDEYTEITGTWPGEAAMLAELAAMDREDKAV